MRGLYVTILCCLLFNYAHSQSKQTGFNKSFIDHIIYPDSLAFKNIPSATLIKISVDAKGSIRNMLLSDSADPVLRQEFEAKKGVLDKTSIIKYIRVNHLKHAILLIPVYFYFQQVTIEPGKLSMEFARKQ